MSNASRKVLWETALTDIKPTDVEGVGSIREDRLGNKYKWVKNNNATNSTAAVNAFAVYATGDRTLVEESIAATLANIAGTFMAEITGGKYGWVHVKGKGKVILFQTAANSTTVIASVAAFVSLKGVSAQDYVVSTNAAQQPDEMWLAGSLSQQEAIAGTATNCTQAVNVVLNFRL